MKHEKNEYWKMPEPIDAPLEEVARVILKRTTERMEKKAEELLA